MDYLSRYNLGRKGASQRYSTQNGLWQDFDQTLKSSQKWCNYGLNENVTITQSLFFDVNRNIATGIL